MFISSQEAKTWFAAVATLSWFASAKVLYCIRQPMKNLTTSYHSTAMVMPTCPHPNHKSKHLHPWYGIHAHPGHGSKVEAPYVFYDFIRHLKCIKVQNEISNQRVRLWKQEILLGAPVSQVTCMQQHCLIEQLLQQHEEHSYSKVSTLSYSLDRMLESKWTRWG